jgi:hypothetical protein
MTWDWRSLLQQLVPVIVGWLFGALGIGPKGATPARIANKES